MQPAQKACWIFFGVATVSATSVLIWSVGTISSASWTLIGIPVIAGLVAFLAYAKVVARRKRAGSGFAALRGAAVAACSYLLTNCLVSILIAAGHFIQRGAHAPSPATVNLLLESLSIAGVSLLVGVGMFGWVAIVIGAATGMILERYVCQFNAIVPAAPTSVSEVTEDRA